ncbi:hypothetical protein WMW72_32615 [Paenibacillus filicis]|uniref:Tissue inhibitor of metalloproteinase n=1 Tax=Paenibacillus filicis TaxID=669464 RepID=A0ABU9DUT6_9BACL
MNRKFVLFALCWMTLFSSWLILHPSTAQACSCATPRTGKEQVENALASQTAIFAGEVTAVKRPQMMILSSDDPVRVNFQVATVWKGELAKKTEVYTALSSSSCGYDTFKVGQAYLVSARTYEGKLKTTICDMTMPLASAAEQLAILGNGSSPSATSLGLGSGTVGPAALAGIVTVVALLSAAVAFYMFRLRRSKR